MTYDRLSANEVSVSKLPETFSEDRTNRNGDACDNLELDRNLNSHKGHHLVMMYRLVASGVAAVSAAAMLYVGLYQSRAVSHLWCPLFARGCEAVADAPFARPFGVPDGYIGAVLYVAILLLLLVPASLWIWIALLALSGLATVANILGVRDMMNLGSFCFYCLTTTLLSPVLLWAVWQLR